jgi:hypothetical protein
MKIPKIDTQHPAQEMKFRNFKMVGCYTDGKLQYYLQIEHIQVKIEASSKKYIIIILYLHNTPMWIKQIQIQTKKHRKHRKLQFDHNIRYTK